jgi:hypothetical protein
MKNVSIVLKVCFLTVFAVSAFTGCGPGTVSRGSAAQIDDQNPPSAPDSPTSPEARPQVLRGWLPEYSSFIEAKVSDVFPALLGISDSRMSTVCPNWGSLDREAREKFWSALLHSIAVPESALTRNMIYREATMSVDAVTGLQIRSEGLLQLSYVDVRNYRYPSGEISWEKDRTMALADYASGTKSGNPKRTLLNAYANLNLGLFIMNRLQAIHPSEKLEKAYGRYWHTMQTTSRSFSKVVSGLKTKIPACF